MQLLDYLNTHFYTKQQLLALTQLSEAQFASFQSQGIMPKCSYKLTISVESDSFFGIHNEAQALEYYAKGYASWIGIIQSLNNEEAVYNVFKARYKNAIETLKEQGFRSQNAKVNEGLSQHIVQEWQHFQDGIYGLCTTSGLPEDIAAKEFAIAIINELSANEVLSDSAREQLVQAIHLLDKSSALFAPHERPNSSRHRLVDEIRRKYQLKNL